MKTPWLIPLLRGVGAVVAALFLVGFFSEMIDSEAVARGVGFALILSAVLLRHLVDGKSFLALLALTLVLAGEIRLFFSCFHEWEVLVAACVLLVLEVVLLLGFPDAFHRFLSTVSAVGLLAVILKEIDLPVPFDVTVLSATVPLVWLWTRSGRDTVAAEARLPVAYGLLAAILGLFVPTALGLTEAAGTVATVGLTLAFGVFAFGLLRRHGADREAVAVGLGVFVLVAFATHQAPGVIASLALAFVAFHQGENKWLAVAAIFLTVFLTGFYCHLDLTLLSKSAMLTTSGVALLVLRLYVKSRILTSLETTS